MSVWLSVCVCFPVNCQGCWWSSNTSACNSVSLKCTSLKLIYWGAFNNVRIQTEFFLKTSFGRSSYKPAVILQFILLSDSSSAEPDDTLDTKVEGREGMELEKWEVKALEALQKAAKAVTGEKHKLMDDTWLKKKRKK